MAPLSAYADVIWGGGVPRPFSFQLVQTSFSKKIFCLLPPIRSDQKKQQDFIRSVHGQFHLLKYPQNKGVYLIGSEGDSFPVSQLYIWGFLAEIPKVSLEKYISVSYDVSTDFCFLSDTFWGFHHKPTVQDLDLS